MLYGAFTVKQPSGAVAYIGAVSIFEHGGWLEPQQGLNPYFYKEYAVGTRTLGEMWTGVLTRFATDLKSPSTGGMHYYAFIHLHKVILFGDPSLALPDLPLADIKANGLDGPVTVSTGQTVTLSLSLEARSRVGAPADWWVLSASPSGWWFYVLAGSFWAPWLRRHPPRRPVRRRPGRSPTAQPDARIVHLLLRCRREHERRHRPRPAQLGRGEGERPVETRRSRNQGGSGTAGSCWLLAVSSGFGCAVRAREETTSPEPCQPPAADRLSS